MMSSLSRGAAISRRCIHRPIVPSSTRLFSRTAIRISKAVPKSRPYSPPSITPLQHTTYATTLAQKSGPTLLYEAPSQTVYMIASYTGGLFCFAYAGYNFLTIVLNPPEGVAKWVPYCFAGVCFMMSVLGTNLLLSPSRMVRQITAIPNKAAAGGLDVRIAIRKMLPVPEAVWPARVITCLPEELALNNAISVSNLHAAARLSPAQRLQIKREQEEAKQKALEIERTKIMTAPFRHASMALHTFFVSVRRTMTKESFAKLYIKNQKYKLDVSGGWALDAGKGVDRLIKIRREI